MFSVANTGDKDAFIHHLELHNTGKTGYVEMSQSLAESGIEKWVIDTRKLTMTFYDKTGHALLVDKLT
jgi:uncharacterized protein YbcV (DUF1398 family)